jgi:hypothetical protein
MKDQVQQYLNTHLYKVLRALKFDKCETVREYLVNIKIYSRSDGKPLKRFSEITHVDDTSSSQYVEGDKLNERHGSTEELVVPTDNLARVQSVSIDTFY